MKKKNVAILGSTGTIGINTLDVIKKFPDLFRVVALSARNNIKLLEKQIKEFHPTHVAIGPAGIAPLKEALGRKRVKVLNAETDLEELVALKEIDVVVIGMSGGAALVPFLKALRLGKTVAPANKEALVIAGKVLMREAKRYKATVIPIDSEQSAIFQCLQGQNKQQKIDRVYLTASGGALLKTPKSAFENLSVKQILAHPRWKMGPKITVDSASLMNKGFEIIEAQHLFELAIDQIEVVIHPQAIIHSMVGFKDGSIMAQLGVTDMRLPIQYALTYPKRLQTHLKSLDFFELRQLTFEKPDFKRFPALALALYAGRKAGTLPAVLNAADEIAVEAFLSKKIKFVDIFRIVEKIVLKHKVKQTEKIAEILEADHWAREEAIGMILN